MPEIVSVLKVFLGISVKIVNVKLLLCHKVLVLDWLELTVLVNVQFNLYNVQIHDVN